jgi:glycosyltransferase involved in cell wall biosynthesis
MMKISIITTTYNSARTLRDTISSVLAQNYADLEYIILDGASTDGTRDLIEEAAKYFGDRLRWLSEPDKGIYDAMNKGIAMATGDVIGFLNSDDFYTSSDVVSRISVELEWSGADAVYGDVHFVNADNLTRCVRYYSSKPFRRGWMRFGFMPAHPSFYCRREMYEHYGMFDTQYKIAADFECLLRLIFINRITTHYIPLDCVTMRMRGASTSGIRSHRQIIKEHLNAYKKNGIYSNILFESVRYLYKIINVYVYSSNTFVSSIMRRLLPKSRRTSGS